MRLLFARAKCVGVAEAWRRQYPRDQQVALSNSTDAVYKALCDLSPADLTPAAVAKIIGNTSWSYYHCAECRSDCERVVSIDDTDTEMMLCPSCCRALAALACADVGA